MISNLISLENKLNEGLIMTHDIHDAKNIIEDVISKWFWFKININNNKIFLNINDGKFTEKTYIEFLILLNNLGYYISNIKITNKYNRINKVTPNDFKNSYLNDDILVNIIEYDFIIEAKFDISHKLKTNILYHVTETRYLDKIIKNGLVAKSKNTLSDYPERIYFTYNLDDANMYIKNKNRYYLTNMDKSEQPIKSKYPKIEFTILEISLPENNNLIFYEDPNFIDKDIYTYDNIEPKFINIFKNN